MSDDEELVEVSRRFAAVVVELYGLLHPGGIASESAIVDGAELLRGLVRQLFGEKERQRASADVLELQVGDRERHLRDALMDAQTERTRLQDDIAGLRMLLTETTAERDQLQDERDVFRDQALPEAARIMNGLSAALIEGEAERDRLQAVVAGCPRCAQRAALTPESLGETEPFPPAERDGSEEAPDG